MIIFQRILKKSEKTKFSEKNFAKFPSEIGFMQSSLQNLASHEASEIEKFLGSGE